MALASANPPSDDLRCRVARLLCRHWDLLDARDQRAAVAAAHLLGAELAEAARETGEEAYGDPKDYRRVCVKFAADCGVANDVEVALWRAVREDPRLTAFALGFEGEG